MEITAIIEVLLWRRGEPPGPQDAPPAVWYDSAYAAGIQLRRLLPQTNGALAERAVALYGALFAVRPVELRWVKWHSYERGVGVVGPCVSWGNHVADLLAERGANGNIGERSRRWAAPQPWREDREEWQVDTHTHRKCIQGFGFVLLSHLVERSWFLAMFSTVLLK